MKKYLIPSMFLIAWCTTTLASEDNSWSESWANKSVVKNSLLMLAANSPSSSSMVSKDASGKEHFVFKERMFTANKIHKYLGIGSLAAAGGTLLAEKEEGGLHETLGDTSAALAVAAAITGFVFHWDEIKLNNGIKDPDNLHLILTTLGTLGLASAVSNAPSGGHGGAGAFGAISMAIGIKMTW